MISTALNFLFLSWLLSLGDPEEIGALFKTFSCHVSKLHNFDQI
jgi:hypothetical protein